MPRHVGPWLVLCEKCGWPHGRCRAPRGGRGTASPQAWGVLRARHRTKVWLFFLTLARWCVPGVSLSSGTPSGGPRALIWTLPWKPPHLCSHRGASLQPQNPRSCCRGASPESSDAGGLQAPAATSRRPIQLQRTPCAPPCSCWSPSLLSGAGGGSGGPWLRALLMSQTWRRKWQSTPVLFSPGKSHGQRSLTVYSPGGRKESDRTELVTYTCIQPRGVRCQEARVNHLGD